MKGSFYSKVFTVAITTFAMFFGAGNLIFPIRIGMESGKYAFLGFFGFAITGVLLPMLGLITIVMFHGNYNNFFGRLGNIVGNIFIFLSMMLIGPLMVMPRIVTLSHEMMRPFVPEVSTLIFGFLFSIVVFIVTFRPGRLLDIIGKFLGPIKILMILFLVFAGLFTAVSITETSFSAWEVFSQGFTVGYATLDVLAALFFGSIILTLLTKYSYGEDKMTIKEAVKITSYASIFAGLLLAGVYWGMTMLGAYHGHGLVDVGNLGEVFITIALRVLGGVGACFMAGTVVLACFVTMISLSAVLSEYVQMAFGKKISFAQALAMVLFVCAIVASFGLQAILEYSEPAILAFYPLIIAITVCNLLHKMWDFKFIKTPVALTAVFVLVTQFIL